MFCARCGNEITNATQKFCEKCGTPVGEAGSPDPIPVIGKKTNSNKKERGIAAVTSKINSLAGGKGSVNLHIKDLFSDVLKHHSSEESEELFICGTTTTTPDVREIATEWPKPWLYSRVGLVLFGAFLLMWFIWKQFGNSNVLPDLLFIGSLAMPITVLMLFFEMNVPRNISFFEVIKVFLIGGTLSLIVTLFLATYIPGSGVGDLIPAMLTGLIEEVGKAVIVAYFIGKIKGRKWLLNGIVLGGAVGAGFAVFESAGYALNGALSNGLNSYLYDISNGYADYAGGDYYDGFYSAMMNSVKMRGFLSPGGHVAWAAVSGFAIVYALGDKEFGWDVLVNTKFLKIFLIPVILHGLWDTSIHDHLPSILSVPIGYFILIIAIWIVLLVFIDRGLNQINEVIALEADDDQDFNLGEIEE